MTASPGTHTPSNFAATNPPPRSRSSSQPPTPLPPSNKLVVGFLKCDKIPHESRKKHGTYEEVLHNLFEPMLPSRLTLETRTFDAVKRELPSEKELDELDALVISGSFEDDAHGDEQWVLRLAGYLIGVSDNYSHIRIIGICFGLQVIARAFGPETIVENPKGWEVGSTKVDLTPLGKQIIWGDEPDAQDFIMSQQIHADIVSRCPSSFELLASSALTPIQGIAHLYPDDENVPTFKHSDARHLPKDPWRRVHIIAFQGHPEWHEDILVPLIDDYEADGIFTAEFAEGARKRSKDPHDGNELGRALLKVLGVGQTRTL